MDTMILDSTSIRLKIRRMAYELNEFFASDSFVLMGIKGNGFALASLIYNELFSLNCNQVTLCEHPLNKRELMDCNLSDMSEVLSNKNVVIVDDVLNTGITLMYASAWVTLQVPNQLYTLVLVDRGYSRFPIKAQWVGLRLNTHPDAFVEVSLKSEMKAFLK
jgi:pyrimidine operon attenuation protein/uracil phosphoribosyltransferase